MIRAMTIYTNIAGPNMNMAEFILWPFRRPVQYNLRGVRRFRTRENSYPGEFVPKMNGYEFSG